MKGCTESIWEWRAGQPAQFTPSRSATHFKVILQV